MARLLGQEDLCHANCVRTLEMVRQMKRATRRQLEAMTGFSWGGITNVVNRLIRLRTVKCFSHQIRCF